MKEENIIAEELISLLRKGNAHISTDEVLKEIPYEKITKKHKDTPYSIWELTEHLRLAQWDIVQFSKGPGHQSPSWPEGYWPKEKNPSENEWNRCLKNIHSDREEMIVHLKNAGDRILDPFPYGTGQSLFREALVLADHNSYHTGEIVLLRRLLGIWK